MIAPPFRWKMMDVAFSDSISKPRRLIVGVSDKYESSRYDTISERGGHGSHSEHSLMTADEWLKWIQRFRDEMTGREIREAIEAVKGPFVEPLLWVEFRERYRLTGDPFLP